MLVILPAHTTGLATSTMSKVITPALSFHPHRHPVLPMVAYPLAVRYLAPLRFPTEYLTLARCNFDHLRCAGPSTVAEPDDHGAESPGQFENSRILEQFDWVCMIGAAHGLALMSGTLAEVQAASWQRLVDGVRRSRARNLLSTHARARRSARNT